MKKWFLAFSLGLNLALMGVLVFLNERYGLLRKIQRVALEEGRILGLVPHHELNRNYQARRGMFQLDRNKSARVLMLGDSLTAQGEWNAMLGAPLVANRGIDGDTSTGVLARLDDDADFHGDAVVIWIGTNDVLQGWAAGPVAERIMEAARGKAEHPRDSAEPKGKTNVWPRGGNRSEAEQILKLEKLKKKNLTTEDTESTEDEADLITIERPGGRENRKLGKAEERATESWPQRGAAAGTMQVNEQPQVGPKGEVAGVTESKEEAGPGLGKPSGAAFSKPSSSELARDSENSSLTRSASGPAISYSLPATAPEAQVFVLGIPPMARWWEGARERNAVIREINARLTEGADQNGYRFIELESVLADENGFLIGEMTSDGVHLSAKGYVAVLEKMKQGPLRGR